MSKRRIHVYAPERAITLCGRGINPNLTVHLGEGVATCVRCRLAVAGDAAHTLGVVIPGEWALRPPRFSKGGHLL